MSVLSLVDHSGEALGQSAEQEARRIIAEELAKLDWVEADMGQRRKGDVRKLRVAQRLRRETTVSERWIAQQLAMGSVGNVTSCQTANGAL